MNWTEVQSRAALRCKGDRSACAQKASGLGFSAPHPLLVEAHRMDGCDWDGNGRWKDLIYGYGCIRSDKEEAVRVSPIFEFLLLLVAFICFVVAAFGSRWASRVNLIALGLALVILIPLIRALTAVS
jgi:hypothetical protein